MPDNRNASNQTRRSTKNYILNSLPKEDFERVSLYLEPVKLSSGQTLIRPEEPIEYIYFPDNAMISVIANTQQGQSAEAGVIGREGVVGIDALMGADTTLNDSIVQLPDGALRLNIAAARREFKRAGAFHDLVLQFIRLMLIQVSQTALCNRLHSTEERLARWLLMCHDRAEKDELLLTQEFLSIMLGANRATVTMSAIALQSAGYVKYKRGIIVVVDRNGLEDFACDCYRTVKKEYERTQKK